MANMERELGIYQKGNSKGKSKGKGKGGKGKGEGKNNSTISTSNKPSDSLSCTRCGKNNHHESQCYHKDKKCDHCGKIGHLKAACRLLNEPPTPSTTGERQAAATTSPPWTCFTCFASNAEPAANKCGHCKAKRLTKTEEKKEGTEKTMIDKRILRVLETGDGQGERMDSGIHNDMDVGLVDESEKEKLKTLIYAA